MKKLIIILTVFFAFVCKSQVTVTGTVIMTGLVPNIYACIGDSLQINFKFKPSGNTSNVPYWSFDFTSSAWPYVKSIRTFSTQEFYSLKKTLSGPDTIYSFKCKVPNSFPDQTHAAVEVTGTGGIPGKPIVLQNCTTTGIEELDIHNSSSTIYFDLSGNRIEKRFNEPMLWQNGILHGKVRIQSSL